MNRVQGIGGIFFKAKDPEALREWYRRHLGIKLEEWGGAVMFTNAGEKNPGYQIWSIFDSTTAYFEPGNATFMINYRVDDLKALFGKLHDNVGIHLDKTAVAVVCKALVACKLLYVLNDGVVYSEI